MFTCSQCNAVYPDVQAVALDGNCDAKVVDQKTQQEKTCGGPMKDEAGLGFQYLAKTFPHKWGKPDASGKKPAPPKPPEPTKVEVSSKTIGGYPATSTEHVTPVEATPPAPTTAKPATTATTPPKKDQPGSKADEPVPTKGGNK